MNAQKPLKTSQELFLRRHKIRNVNIRISRILILFSFLFIWELSAQMNWIDSFFFSSPSLVLKCFLEMLYDLSFFTHTGITLLETLISFVILLFICLAAATLLWASPILS
ncbi:MAG: ABC transporter permease, partial [Lachnospiraceae bacterium]|nr:ABC transporter permease [Lachnospiraceae bacterium]